ncbi:hypothetical protein BV20DRAFT_985413 [Pilatotrama ljubarskyi]|nr:hypothetical protein BV20DRAFT_985413 [Pilatotrama ljubarskyi]
MSIAPEPSASRGEVALQPSYFTSSLYVDALREDISGLINSFSKQYNEAIRPFELFKKIWVDQGWSWLHLRIFGGRSRQAFLRTTQRLFIERLAAAEAPVARAVALFSLYTFHNTQPSTSSPPTYSLRHIEIPIDMFEDMLSIPSALEELHLRGLKPYVSYLLTTLLDAQAFHVLPHSSLNAQNPSKLPREVFAADGQESSVTLQTTALSARSQEAGASAPPKKKGRPSKRDKIRKAKEALASLERYVDRNYVALPEEPSLLHMTSGAALTYTEPARTGHALFAQAPAGSLTNYSARKHDLLLNLHSEPPDGPQTAALRRANEAVLARLKQIDEMAAEQGLEVGGEGGDKTGLARVEKAVEELRQVDGPGASGGILGLLEGAGLGATTA